MRNDGATGTGPSIFSIFVAQGGCDVLDWDRHYSPARWHATSAVALEPDVKGSDRPVIGFCGWPDGGTSVMTTQRGWVYELGSEEEVEFLAAVAAQETEGYSIHALNFSARSHMLLAVLYLAFLPTSQRDEYRQNMRRQFLEKDRLRETTVDEWIDNVLGLMEPYASEQKVLPSADKDRMELFRRSLAENGQVFARGGWRFSKRGPPRGFKFDLEVAMENRRRT